MSKELPTIPTFKNTLQNFEIAIRMGNHRRKMEQLNHRKQRSNSTISYRDVLIDNPKKLYLLENKYTEIERENRLLLEKIAQTGKRKKSPKGWGSQHHVKSLNTTFRKQQIESIERENTKMFDRIQKQKASISFKHSDKEFEKTKAMSHRLSTLEKNKLYDWYC